MADFIEVNRISDIPVTINVSKIIWFEIHDEGCAVFVSYGDKLVKFIVDATPEGVAALVQDSAPVASDLGGSSDLGSEAAAST